MGKHKKPLNRSITIGCIIFIVALCACLSFANLTLYKNSVYDDYRNYITHILNYTLSGIDGDDLKTCIATGEESETYLETQLFMDNLIENFGDIHYLYAVLPLNEEETGNTMSVLSAERYYDRYIDTEGNLYLGWISDDEFDSKTAAMFANVMNGDEIVYFEEQTEWGADYTGAVPIKDSNGENIAVLAADVDISFINNMVIQYAAINILIIFVLGAFFIGLFLLWSHTNITKPIKKLELSAVGFADHSHGQRDVSALRFEAPEMKSDNEIKSLSDAVVKMADDMRDYVTDIVSAEEKAENMQQLATRDALTGVMNKTAYYFETKRLEELIENGETNVGLAIADLNFLKKVNDTYGHDKGDLAIKKLCRTVCDTFAHSPVYRIGGDEFVIVLLERDFDDFEELKDRFYATISDMADDETLEPWEKVSAALGAAFYDPAFDSSVDDLFRRADYAMYDCKKEMNALRTS